MQVGARLKIQCNTDIRKCILQLQSLGLSCNKLGQIIQTVSENIFKVDIPKSPCRTTIQNIIDEGHYLSRKQVGSALTKPKIGICLLTVQIEMVGKF
jgi:hypothetical protein